MIMQLEQQYQETTASGLALPLSCIPMRAYEIGNSCIFFFFSLKLEVKCLQNIVCLKEDAEVKG